MTQLVALAPDQIGPAWPHIRGHLETISQSARGKLTAEDIAMLGAGGHMNLWVVLSDDGTLMATVAAETITYPRQKVARICGLAGNDRKAWLHHLREIEDWARADGCKGMQIAARKGWVRELPEYLIACYLLERDL